MLINSLILLLSFCTLWLASELIVVSMSKFANRFNISSFAASFFILGLLTSIPETSIGISAALENRPDIFVGNMIGGSVVIFLFILPLLAIFGNGVTITHALPPKHLLFTIFVIALPAFSMLNGTLYWPVAIIMLGFYALLFYVIHKRKGVVETIEDAILPPPEGTKLDFIKVVVGMILILGASRTLVYVIPLMADAVGIPSFLVSLIILSLGTNLPELFIAIQSVLNNDKGVAIGDYLGSAAANTLVFSVLSLLSTFLHGTVVVANGKFLPTFIIFATGLVLFYLMARSKDEISRKEGFALLCVYIIFLISEITLR